MILLEEAKMYIRNGFVTNSSSTSYVIISDNEIDTEGLIKKLGIEKDSPLYNVFYDVCNRIVENGHEGIYHHSFEESINKELLEDNFSKETAEKVIKALAEGKFVYIGTMSNEYDEIESCLAMDCFIIDEDDFLFDATSCVY